MIYKPAKLSQKVLSMVSSFTAADYRHASASLDKTSTSASSVTDEDSSPSSLATPLTPYSPIPLSRYPSDLKKSHHCMFDGCNRSYNRPAKLEQHVRSHTNARLFICPHSSCAKDFLRGSHLKQHIKSAHSDIRDYQCNQDGCQKSFLTATRLRRHLAAHEGREKYRCVETDCGKTFRKHSTLQAHLDKVHKGIRPHLCAFLKEDGHKCGRGFDTIWKLRDHCGRMHEIKHIFCTICPQSATDKYDESKSENGLRPFPTHAALQDHIAAEHPPTCSQCGTGCLSQAALNSHIEVYHSTRTIDERKTYRCLEPHCEASFTKKGNLNVHLRTIHGDEYCFCGNELSSTWRDIECWNGSDACGASFKTKAKLENHIRTAHLNLDPVDKGKADREEKRARRKILPTLTKLTGSGYNKASEGQIPCPVHRCHHQFLQDYDRDIHLKSYHGLADSESQGMQEYHIESLYMQPAFQEYWNLAMAEDVEADGALDIHFAGSLDTKDVDENIEAAASKGGNSGLAAIPTMLQMEVIG